MKALPHSLFLFFFLVLTETVYRNYHICRSETLQWIHVLCSMLLPAGQCVNGIPIIYFGGWRGLHQCICKCFLWGWILAENELGSISLKSILSWFDHFKPQKIEVENKIQKMLSFQCLFSFLIAGVAQKSWHNSSKESSNWIKWIVCLVQCSIIHLWTTWASRRCSRERQEIQD